MTITITAVGRLKEKFWVQAAEEYLKRMKPYAKVTVKEIPDVDPGRAGGVEAAREREGEAILDAISGKSFVILLAIQGQEMSSVALSQKMQQLAARGASQLTFLIGSSFGLDEDLKKKADLRLSMSPMTFPHHLARVMLLEQIYRAYQIEAGTKYHK